MIEFGAVNFGNPYGLYWLLLILILPLRALKEARGGFGGAAFKGMVIICLAAAASDPIYILSEKVSNSVVLMDVSDSSEPGVNEQLLSKARSALLSGDTKVIPFAGKSGGALPINLSFDSIKSGSQKLDIGATNLESGLRAASGFASVVLISDGRETAGRAVEAAQALQAQGSKIFPLIPDSPPRPESYFKITNLYAPLTAPAQKSVQIRASLANTTDSPQTGRIELSHDGRVLYAGEVTLPPGKEAVVSADSDPAIEGIKEIKAVFTPRNSALPSSSEIAYLSGERRERVLLLSGDSDDEGLILKTLEGQAYQTAHKLASGGRISDLGRLEDYSALILNNVRYDALPSGSGELIRSYVKNGGGLVMIGGSRSFGLGGYRGTPVETALPVNLLPPQTVKRRLNSAIELILDKSQSMAENEKLQLTKEAARELIRNLKDEDYIGVIGFDSVPFEVVEMTRVGAGRDEALRNVGLLFPRGKTNLMPAIDEGRRRLELVAAGRKHMIILTDGQLPDGGPTYLELTKQLRLEGITVSTVMVGGEGVDQILQGMAEIGGGSFYQTFDPRSLPKIFLSDVKVASGEQTMKESLEYLVRRGPDDIQSTKIESFPPVRGYVETDPKKGAQNELVAFGEGKAEPLLVSWRYGSGRSAAFTSDANGRWSDYWIRWPKFGQFWTDILDSVRPKSPGDVSAVKYDLRTSVERGELNLSFVLYGETLPRDASAALTLPDGSSRAVNLKQSALGRYSGVMPGAMAGKYEIQLTAAGKKLTPAAFVLSGELFGERKGEGFDAALLQSLARMSGGRINPGRSDLDGNMATRESAIRLAPWLMLLAFGLMVLNIWRRETPRRAPRARFFRPV